MCNRYGVRPSTIIGIDDNKMAMDFDCAVAIRADMAQQKKLPKVDKEGKPVFKTGIEGIRYMQMMEARSGGATNA